jgi:hypothetical protein
LPLVWTKAEKHYFFLALEIERRMNMVDCVGKELKIGDKVVCSDMLYADLLIGEIIDFTPKKARVRYTRSEHQSLPPHEQLKESYQIFKYSDSEVVGAIFATPKSEVAREIFTDIQEDCFDQFGYFDYDAFAQIKKKYIGVTTNEQQQTDASRADS